MVERAVEVAAPMQHEKSGNMVEAAADIFDTDGFDPIGYINKMFPSGKLPATMLTVYTSPDVASTGSSHAENSLVGLDPLIGTLKHRVSWLLNAICLCAMQISETYLRYRFGGLTLRYFLLSGSRAAQDLVQSEHF